MKARLPPRIQSRHRRDPLDRGRARATGVANNVAMRSPPYPIGQPVDSAAAADSGERVRALRARDPRPDRGLPWVVVLACTVFASVVALALNS